MTEGEALKKILDNLEYDALGLLHIHKTAVSKGWGRQEILNAIKTHYAEMVAAIKEDFAKQGA